MPRVAGAHRLLAGFLAGAVDAKRRDRVVFEVGARGVAIEDIVGGDMDERDPGPAGFLRPGSQDASALSRHAASISVSALSTAV